MVRERMPFGKHYGKFIDDIDTNYLIWVMRNVVDLKPFIESAIAGELRGRRVPPAAFRRPGDQQQDEAERTKEKCHEYERQQDEHRRRRERSSTQGPSSSSKPLIDLAALLGRTRRELAMKYHPDRGGSSEIMKGVNIALDHVQKLVGVA